MGTDIPLSDLPCTCGGRGICLADQLREAELTEAADLLLLDPFVVAADEAHHRLGRALADAFAGPSNVYPIRKENT